MSTQGDYGYNQVRDIRLTDICTNFILLVIFLVLHAGKHREQQCRWETISKKWLQNELTKTKWHLPKARKNPIWALSTVLFKVWSSHNSFFWFGLFFPHLALTFLANPDLQFLLHEKSQLPLAWSLPTHSRIWKTSFLPMWCVWAQIFRWTLIKFTLPFAWSEQSAQKISHYGICKKK